MIESPTKSAFFSFKKRFFFLQKVLFLLIFFWKIAVRGLKMPSVCDQVGTAFSKYCELICQFWEQTQCSVLSTCLDISWSMPVADVIPLYSPIHIHVPLLQIIVHRPGRKRTRLGHHRVQQTDAHRGRRDQPEPPRCESRDAGVSVLKQMQHRAVCVCGCVKRFR